MSLRPKANNFLLQKPLPPRERLFLRPKPPLAAPCTVRGGGICEANDGGDLFQISECSELCCVRIPSGPPGQRPYPLWPFGPFPPDRGNRPLEPKGSLSRARSPRRGGRLCPPAGCTDFTKTLGESVCTFPLVCRGRCPHQPGRMRRFYGNLRRIRNCPKGRQSRRPLQETVCIPPLPALFVFAENTCSVHRRRSVV